MLADKAPKMKETYLVTQLILAKSKNPPNVSYQWGNRKYALFWTLLKYPETGWYTPKSLLDIFPKSDPKIVQKITQIAVILRETDSWLDSQNIHMNFVQILVVQLPKRESKIHFFGTLLKSN